jgi:hypothetical protein
VIGRLWDRGSRIDPVGHNIGGGIGGGIGHAGNCAATCVGGTAK